MIRAREIILDLGGPDILATILVGNWRSQPQKVTRPQEQVRMMYFEDGGGRGHKPRNAGGH